MGWSMKPLRRNSPTRFLASSFFHPSNQPGPLTNGLKYFQYFYGQVFNKFLNFFLQNEWVSLPEYDTALSQSPAVLYDTALSQSPAVSYCGVLLIRVQWFWKIKSDTHKVVRNCCRTPIPKVHVFTLPLSLGGRPQKIRGVTLKWGNFFSFHIF